MFKRRRPRDLWDKAREAFWPRMGWGRLVRYYGHRVGRLAGTPHAIAVGLACGVFISFTPLMGLHLAGAAALAALLRGNVLAGLLGTLVGNPYTFPPIWWSVYEVGSLILGRDTTAENPLPAHFSLGFLFEDPMRALEGYLPAMMVGGTILGGLAAYATYRISRPIIAKYQQARRLRRIKALARRKPLAAPVRVRRPATQKDA